MRVVLRQLPKGQDSAEIAVCQRRFLLGRASDCDVRLTSPWISRHHCQLIIEHDRVTLEDLASLNGTFVNGERIWDERELESGDRLGLGASVYEVAIEQDLRALPEPAEGARSFCPAAAC
jgi:pSer/pThr/pTyr-binding forkhead associated (FHA) protein